MRACAQAQALQQQVLLTSHPPLSACPQVDPKSDGAARDWVAIYDECSRILCEWRGFGATQRSPAQPTGRAWSQSRRGGRCCQLPPECKQARLWLDAAPPPSLASCLQTRRLTTARRVPTQTGSGEQPAPRCWASASLHRGTAMPALWPPAPAASRRRPSPAVADASCCATTACVTAALFAAHAGLQGELQEHGVGQGAKGGLEPFLVAGTTSGGSSSNRRACCVCCWRSRVRQGDADEEHVPCSVRGPCPFENNNSWRALEAGSTLVRAWRPLLPGTCQHLLPHTSACRCSRWSTHPASRSTEVGIAWPSAGGGGAHQPPYVPGFATFAWVQRHTAPW